MGQRTCLREHLLSTVSNLDIRLGLSLQVVTRGLGIGFSAPRLLEGDTQVTVNPGETTYARITFENGSLRVEVTWALPPSAPTGVHEYFQGGRVQLSWNPNPRSDGVAGHLIYRSTGELEPLSLLSHSLVHGTTYEDATTAADATYWYSVQAYNADGFSGGLSERAMAASENIMFQDIRTVGRLESDCWQLSFTASPPFGRSIVSGSVVTPEGIVKPMHPQAEIPDRWSAWWNIRGPEPGTYRQTVEYDSGELGILYTDVSLGMFTSIQLPALVAPYNQATLHTLTPMLEYLTPVGVDRTYVALHSPDTNKTIWFGPCGPDNFQIPDEVLTRGNEYRWHVSCTTDHPTGVHLQGSSKEWYFTVAESE